MATKASQSVDLPLQNSEKLEEKNVLVTNKLTKRDENRLADVQKRKEEREKTAAVNESADYFHETFNRARTELESDLTRSDSLEKSKLIEHFDDTVASLQKMQKFLSDSSMFLPAYEVQRAQETVMMLHTSMQEKRIILIPKKKFAFKGKKKAALTEKSDVDVVDSTKVEKSDITVAITECNFSDLSDQKLTKNPDELNQKDVALARLTGCTVKLYGSPSSIHVNNLTDCLVFSGPVSSSVFIDNCKGCTFILPCQQLRVHTTTDNNFYLHVTSRAIIEDSTRLTFSPFNWTYDGLDDHYEMSGLDKKRNTWNDVDDFNWLASDARSPNWCVLDEKERINSWND